jgi:hypothetical protein
MAKTKIVLFRSPKSNNWIGKLQNGLIVGHRDMTAAAVAKAYNDEDYSVSETSILIGFGGAEQEEVMLDLTKKVKKGGSAPKVQWEEDEE